MLLNKKSNAICKIKLSCKFKFCGPGGAAPDQTPQSQPVKKHIPEISFLRDHYAGSASEAIRASPQRRFFMNCKNVLRAGRMRGLLELLLAGAPRRVFPSLVDALFAITPALSPPTSRPTGVFASRACLPVDLFLAHRSSGQYTWLLSSHVIPSGIPNSSGHLPWDMCFGLLLTHLEHESIKHIVNSPSQSPFGEDFLKERLLYGSAIVCAPLNGHW